MILYATSFGVVASVRRTGYLNVFQLGKGWMTVDPNGTVSYSPDNIDQNYQQFTRNGVMLEIAPGDDNNPNAMRFVLLPEQTA